jgi:hypothetical protein
VGSTEVILNEPFGKPTIEFGGLGGHVAHLDELFLQGTVKAFISSIILGGLDSGVVLLNSELSTGLAKIPLEFAAIIMTNILNLSCQEKIEPIKKVTGIE